MYTQIKKECAALSEKDVNHEAIKNLLENRFYESFLMFYFNTVRYSTYRAHHNLGCFYHEIGKYTLDGQDCGVNEALAVRHLRNALRLRENYHTFCELGILYYENQAISAAKRMFQKSLQYSSTWYNHHMYGCSLFRQEKYREAEAHFLFAYENSKGILGETYPSDQMLGNYGVCRAIQGDSEAEKIAGHLVEKFLEDPHFFPISAAEFIFFYLGRYQDVMNCYQLLKNHYVIDDESFKLYLFSYYQIDPEGIDCFFEELLELEDIYDFPLDTAHYQVFLEEVKTKKYLLPRFTPFHLYEYHFIE